MRIYTPKDANLVPREAEKVFSGKIFDIYHWRQKMFDDSYVTFEMAKRHDTVNILAIHNDRIIAIREKQPGRDFAVSLPGGRHDNENETELEAAKRELLEETGLSFRKWKLVYCFEPTKSTNKIEWLFYLFIAWDFDKGTEQNLDAGEKIELEYLSYDDFLRISSSPNGGILKEFHDVVEKAGNINGLLELPNLMNVSPN